MAAFDVPKRLHAAQHAAGQPDEVTPASIGAAPASRFLTGTGSPEGVIAAPVGTTYTDTAATAGAVEWTKWSGTGTTGWRVTKGDTGWRGVTPSPLPATLSSGTVLVRRSGNTASVRFDRIKLGAGAVTGFNVFDPGIALGAGFAPNSVDRTTLGISDSGMSFVPVFTVYISSNILYVRYLWSLYRGAATSTLPASDNGFSGQVTWLTNDPWPTTLPGTPA